ncbi:MAG: FtsX-like permease family protein [Acidimicrobiales bacterium]
MIKVSLRGLLSHKFRLLLTIVAVLVSVAFMAGTQILTATVSASFDKVFDDVYKNIDVVVRSTDKVDTGFGAFRDSIADSVVPTVAAVPGVTAAEGQVQGQISILDRQGEPIGNPQSGPPTFGLNWLTQPELNGWRLDEGRAPAGPDQVVLDKKTADTAGYRVGDTVKIQTNKGVNDFVVSGIAGFGTTDNYAGTAAALFTTARSQELLVEPGKVTWINVAGQDGLSQEELASRIRPVLPAKAEAITGKAFTAESQDVFRRIFDFLGIALLIFGIVALVVGAFIIYNTFSIIVAQRTKELALLRAMGASRRQILGSVTLEALVVGIVASALGVLGGIGLAWVLTTLLGATGGGIGEDGLTYPPSAFVISMAVGTAVTLVSGFFPAWRASRVPPVAAMRDVAVDTGGRTRVRGIIGAIFVVLGGAAMYVGLFTAEQLSLVGLGIAGVFLGVIVVGPLFAKPMSRIIGSPLRQAFTGQLARENAMRNPRRTAATASALMIGVGLIATFAILIESIKATVGNALDTAFTASLVIDSRANPGQPALPLDTLDKVKAVPGVAAVGGLEGGFATIGGSPTQVLGSDLATLGQFLKIQAVEGDLAALGPDQIAVPAKRAQDEGWKVGTQVPSTFLVGGAPPVTIGATYEIAGLSTGIGTLMTMEGFAKRQPPPFQTYNQIYVTAAPGADVAAIQAQLKPLVKGITPTATVQDASEFASSQTGFLDILLIVVSVLLVLAIIIAILGIINTLLLSVYERTRELGLLRAVGMKRSQTGAMVMWESVIFSLQGTAIGLVIGFVFGSALVKAIAAQLEGVSFAVPWALLVGMVIAAIIGGIGAGLLPAWSASRLKVLDAIATE